jgi:hypothetical protein
MLLFFHCIGLRRQSVTLVLSAVMHEIHLGSISHDVSCTEVQCALSLARTLATSNPQPYISLITPMSVSLSCGLSRVVSSS